MTTETFDRIAEVLKEAVKRYPKDVFADRRRLSGLLSDHINDADSEIRVVSNAIQDGVVDQLLQAPANELDLHVNRLAGKLERAWGLKPEIAQHAIRACAYAVGRGELPSRYAVSASDWTPTPPSQGQTEWVGVSQVVQPPPQSVPGAPVAREAAASPFASAAAAQTWFKKNQKTVLGGAAAVIAALYFIGQKAPDQGKDQPAEPPPRPQQPQQPEQPPPRGNQPQQPPPRGNQPQQPGNPGAGPGAPADDQLSAWERQDFGVPPIRQLHTGAMHGNTPTQIPGGQVITTRGMAQLFQNQNVRPLVLDALGGEQQLPGSVIVTAASQPGSFNDSIQQQFGQALERWTQGSKDTPLIFYCLNPQCWMSYNAALRAINLGYRNVLWYRGGLEAWQRAGLQTVNAQQQQQQQPQQQPQQQRPQSQQPRR